MSIFKRTENTEVTTGKIGEKLAKEYLLKHGFKVLSENYKGKKFEIDLIGRKGRVFYFFEIKTSVLKTNISQLDQNILPVEQISNQKLNKILRGARCFLKEKEKDFERTKWKICLVEVLIFLPKRNYRISVQEMLSS